MKREPIKVGSLTFVSKAELKRFCSTFFEQYRNAINGWDSAIEIKEQHMPFVTDLIKRHPDKKLDLCGAKVFITKNFSGGSHMFVILADKTRVDFSWVKCCHQRTESSKALLIEAMRTAISHQLFSAPLSKKCVQCGSNTELEIDHVISFKEISEEFLMHNAPHPRMFTECPKTMRTDFKEEDVEFSIEWQEFHSKRAIYQVLCRPCHIKKSTSPISNF